MTARALEMSALYDLRLKPLWRAFKAEGPELWLLCTYIMFEYVRPQSAYPALAFFPWTAATMMGTVVTVLASRHQATFKSPANTLLVVYTIVLLLSAVGAYRMTYSVADFDGYFLWLLVYWLICRIVTTERRMLMLMLMFTLVNLKMSLFATRSWASIGFGFRDWGVGGAPGWFQNSGEFGVEMCVFFPIATYLALGLRPYLPKWKFLALLGVAATSLAGMVASSSRGAQLGGAAVMLFMLLRSKYKVRGLIFAVTAGTAFYFVIPQQQKERMSASGADKTSELRLTYWKRGVEITNEHPLLGVGYSNWVPFYRDHYDGPAQVPHNIFVQAAAELGYTGLLAFVLLIGCTFVLNWRSRALAQRAGPPGRLTYHLACGFDGALIGYMVSGFFVTVLYYPFFWVNLAMTVALNAVAHGLTRGTQSRALSPTDSTARVRPGSNLRWQPGLPQR